MLKRGADRLAASERLPTALRAVLGYYADSGVFDYRSLQLQRRVDDATDAMVDTAFEAVEEVLGDAFGAPVTFEYDTKLVLPAELTLGYLYRRTDCADVRAEAITRLAIEALVDGDMRDAINDDEYGDFEVTVGGDPATDDQRREAAQLAQETLQTRVERQFDVYPDAVREEYEWAVEISEAHQSEDPHFRELMERARDGDEEAREAIRAEYRDAEFDDPPAVLSPAERDLPYVRTQYDRVGVIYDGMLGIYRAAGFTIGEHFERSIVLAIIGAQIWLDDVDDYAADMREGQLTPVTAEYLLAEDDAAAYDRVLDVTETYLTLAKSHATEAESPLTGIATEYIYRDGTPEVLPGSH